MSDDSDSGGDYDYDPTPPSGNLAKNKDEAKSLPILASLFLSLVIPVLGYKDYKESTTSKRSLESKVEKADLTPKQFYGGLFSFTYTSYIEPDISIDPDVFSTFSRNSYKKGFQGVSDLVLFPRHFKSKDALSTVSINLADELNSGNITNRVLNNIHVMTIDLPLIKEIDFNKDGIFSLRELNAFYNYTKAYINIKPLPVFSLDELNAFYNYTMASVPVPNKGLDPTSFGTPFSVLARSFLPDYFFSDK